MHNISIGTEKPCVIIDRVDSTFLTVTDNFDFNDDEKQKLFVDPDNMDFTLKNDALIFRLDSVSSLLISAVLENDFGNP